MSPLLSACTKVPCSVTSSPRSTIYVPGGESLRSDVWKPSSSHDCLKLLKPLVGNFRDSTQNTSSKKAPVVSCSSWLATKCRGVTTVPQFAGDLRLPKGCASTFALYGRLLIGFIKQI